MVKQMICWKCREKVQLAICVSCGVIQPPIAKADLFQVLTLPRKYFLQREDIETAHRAIARQVHPDRFRQRSAVERRMSLQWTALVNEARRVLLDPILRARYLATGQAAPNERSGTSDPAFLEKIFELQMSMMESPEQSIEQAKSLAAQNDSQLISIFQAWEAGQGDLDGIEELLGRWKYLNNILSKEEK